MLPSYRTILVYCLMMTKLDFREIEASLWLNKKSGNGSFTKGCLSTSCCWEASIPWYVAWKNIYVTMMTTTTTMTMIYFAMIGCHGWVGECVVPLWEERKLASWGIEWALRVLVVFWRKDGWGGFLMWRGNKKWTGRGNACIWRWRVQGQERHGWKWLRMIEDLGLLSVVALDHHAWSRKIVCICANPGLPGAPLGFFPGWAGGEMVCVCGCGISYQ